MKKLFIILFVFIVSCTTVISQTYTFTNIPLDDVHDGTSVWGDINNDGSLDLLLTGSDDDLNKLSNIYRYDNGNYVNINAGLSGVDASDAALGDYDSDGDLDVLISGESIDAFITKIYRNNGDETFTDINASLIGLRYSSVAWGDYDNDGDLDILMAGLNQQNHKVTKLYRNNSDDSFTDIEVTLPYIYGDLAWGDCDNDGDLDILIAGIDTNAYYVSEVYSNIGNDEFNDMNVGLPGVFGSVAFGDYDSDGDLDLLMEGESFSGGTFIYFAEIYKNEGDFTFTSLNNSFTGVKGSVLWGDYDNDGDLDGVISGGAFGTTFLRNDSNDIFTEANEGVTGLGQNSLAFGDYDNDDDLDVLLTGKNAANSYSMIYRNDSSATNILPASPTGLISQDTMNEVTLSWNKSTDSETEQNGLTYNIRFGTFQNGLDIVTPMADITTGYRKVIQLGNTNHDTTWIIKELSIGNYFWSVQTIDNDFAGSPFASEQSFDLLPTSDFAYPTNTCLNDTVAITYTGNASGIATYNWDFAAGTIISGTGQGPYQVQWQTSGVKNISLFVYENGLYSDTTYNILTVDTTYYFIELDSICNGDSIQWQDNYYDTSGTYFANYYTVFGCDSTFELQLTVNQTYYFTDSLEICEGDSVQWQGSFYHTAGTFTTNYSTILGCDSIYNLQLAVNPNPVSFIITGEDAVSVNQIEIYNVPTNSDVVYTWVVQNGIIINQISNSSVEIKWTNIGTGFINVFSENQYGCISDTAILEVTVGTVGIDNLTNNRDIAIFPNPFNNTLTVACNTEFVLEIYDITGNILITSKYKITDVSSLKSGTYIILLKGLNDKILVNKQFIKK